jgi:hypothetical protein
MATCNLYDNACTAILPGLQFCRMKAQNDFINKVYLRLHRKSNTQGQKNAFAEHHRIALKVPSKAQEIES